MSQYIWYTFNQNSTTITNYGDGGAGYNGQATRAQYAQNSLGNPIWGPLNDNNDGIRVPGGISNPYQHTWEVGLRINQWWPVLGIVNGILCGNDGKLWAFADNQGYAYIHEQTNNGVPTGDHIFTVELTGGGAHNVDSVQFWLGVGGQRPFKVPAYVGYEGRVYWAYASYILQLNVDYYFQVSINLNPGEWAGGSGSNYTIGNCLGQPCTDYMVTGFPLGCYLYCWREYNHVVDLSGGGDWASDVTLWNGGTPPDPGPGPGPTPPGPNVPAGADVAGGAGIDILPYLQKAHNGQVTPGLHTVEITPVNGKANLSLGVNVREYQTGLQ